MFCPKATENIIFCFWFCGHKQTNKQNNNNDNGFEYVSRLLFVSFIFDYLNFEALIYTFLSTQNIHIYIYRLFFSLVLLFACALFDLVFSSFNNFLHVFLTRFGSKIYSVDLFHRLSLSLFFYFVYAHI